MMQSDDFEANSEESPSDICFAHHRIEEPEGKPAAERYRSAASSTVAASVLASRYFTIIGA